MQGGGLRAFFLDWIGFGSSALIAGVDYSRFLDSRDLNEPTG
jgi:hypothetical protein